MDSVRPLRKRSPLGYVDFERECLRALPDGFEDSGGSNQPDAITSGR